MTALRERPRLAENDLVLRADRYTTVVKRWPTIITQIISTVSNVNHSLHFDSSAASSSDIKLQEGKKIISELSALKHEMGKNSVLTPIEDDGGDNVECYNVELGRIPDEEKKWFTMNWLFAECYLCVHFFALAVGHTSQLICTGRYRRIRTYFAKTSMWKEFDPFFTSKAETYKSSSGAIIREYAFACWIAHLLHD